VFRGEGRATRYGQKLIMKGESRSPYEATAEMGGSPVRCGGGGEGDPPWAELDDGWGGRVARRYSSRDGWVARTQGIGDVGVTQQAQIGASAVDVRWQYMAMFGIGGSHWRGQDDTPEGECEPALCWIYDDRVTDRDDAFGEDLGAQTTAVDQAGQDAGVGEAGEMLAGLAETHPTQADWTNLELLSDELVEGHAEGDDVAARFGGGEMKSMVIFKGLQGLNLDQGDISTGSAALSRCAWWTKIAVALQTQTGDNSDRSLRPGDITMDGGGINRNDSAWRHGFYSLSNRELYLKVGMPGCEIF
jgi:hypothetical protein